MTAKIIDGKAIAAELRGKVADAVAPALARPRHHAGARRGARRQQSGERELRRQQDQDDGRQRHALVRPPAARRRRARPSCWRWSRGSTPIPTVHGILVQLPLPAQIDAQKVIAAVDPAKDVDGFNPVNAGRLSAGLPALAPCTPVGCVSAGQNRAAFAHGARGGGDRPLQHRRQAVGATAAGGERDRDGRAFPDPRAGCGVPARRPSVRGGRPARNGAARLDQARRDRHRCRHQPRDLARMASRASSATWRLRKSREIAGAHHAGAGRRRADDHRLPARQHRARRLRASPACRSRRSTPAEVGRGGLTRLSFPRQRASESVRRALPDICRRRGNAAETK